MDKEYLQNIAGSLLVDEGLGSQILARGTAGAQRMAAMTGGQFSDVNYTKVESIFGRYLRKIAHILNDFAGGPNSIANRLEQMRPPISEPQRKAIQQLRDLYGLIVPSIFTQHQLSQSILNTRTDSRSNLTEMLKEGIWSRDMALNLALQSNNPTKIINAYLTALKNEFSTFMRDSMKATGTPKDYVKRVVYSLNPRWGSIINKAEQVSSESPSTPQPQTSTQTSTPQASVTPAGQSESPVANSPTATTQQSKQKMADNDFANIVSRVVDIIIETVRSDVERAEKFISKDPTKQKELPTEWETPAVTKESLMEDDEESQTEPSDEHEDDHEPVETSPEDTESTGEFLYNFHSRYDKQRNFAIDVDPPDKSLKIVSISNTGQTKQLEVIWSNKVHENEIYVKHTPVKKQAEQGASDAYISVGKTQQVLLFKFWDDQVNPRNEQSKKFSIELLLRQANPNSLKIYSGADASVRSNVESKTAPLLRSLYATTYRKAMEFKRKPFQLTFDEKGNLFRIKKGGVQEPISHDQLMGFLNSKDPKERERWKSSLDKIGYFQKFPQMTPQKTVNIDEIPNAMDAVKSLMALGYKAVPAMKAVQASIDQLGKQSSTEEYVKTALKQPKEDEPTPGVSKEPSGPATPDKPDTSVSGGVSAPVSGGASAPVTTDPTAPVSNGGKPTPDKEPSGTKEAELGKATWDENGIVTWEKPSKPGEQSKVVKITPKQLKNMKSPRLELLLKKQGYFDKFPESKKKDLTEEIVNPFDLSNLLI